MRALEIVLCITSLPLLVWCLRGRALPPWTRVLPAVALLVMVLQIALEGSRWHMGPAYVVTGCLVLTWPWSRVLVRRRWTALCGIALLAGAAIAGTVLPVFELPNPTGPYPIGTISLHLVDPTRGEAHRPGEPREVMVQVWYPAQCSGPGQAYRTAAETEFKKRHLALVRTHAAAGVPVADAVPRYPLVLFSPSWTGRRNQNTVQAEELASHGFVVAGIDHPYGTDLTIFPDGRVVRTSLGELLDYSSDQALEASLRSAEAELQIRAGDAGFVVEALEGLRRSDPENPLGGRIDTARAGIFGHSFGGAVTAEVCRSNPRFVAGIDLDGLLFGEVVRTGIGKPFLTLADYSPVSLSTQLERAQGASRRELLFLLQNRQALDSCLAECQGYLVGIRGVSHMNFCDSPLYSPVKRLTHAGPIGRERAMEIINAYVVSFFQTHLQGKPADLDALSRSYPEVDSERVSKDKLSTAVGKTGS